MITAVPGVRVGHWTHHEARTGCTVVLFPDGTVGSGEVRGGAPATREFDLLAPGRLVTRLDAVVLTGGSAFGLAAADGVARWCEEQGRGFPTVAGLVPIVVAMGLYDLAVGDPSVRPDAGAGYQACLAASPGEVALGPVGAGTGATVGKHRPGQPPRPGGVGGAVRRVGELVVAALVAVNAYGDVVPAGAEPEEAPPPPPADAAFGSTTVGVVVTNAALDKAGCLAVAGGGHDGLARAIHPPHTAVDGDAVVAAASGAVSAAVDTVRALAVVVMAAAVRAAVASHAGAAG